MKKEENEENDSSEKAAEMLPSIMEPDTQPRLSDVDFHFRHIWGLCWRGGGGGEINRLPPDHKALIKDKLQCWGWGDITLLPGIAGNNVHTAGVGGGTPQGRSQCLGAATGHMTSASRNAI